MAIAHIVTRGYGNGTLAGTITDVVLRGYSIGDAVVIPSPSVGPEFTLNAIPETRVALVLNEVRDLLGMKR